MEKEINLNKVIWEGWTVKMFIDDLDFLLQMNLMGKSWFPIITTKKELKTGVCIINHTIKSIYQKWLNTFLKSTTLSKKK